MDSGEPLLTSYHCYGQVLIHDWSITAQQYSNYLLVHANGLEWLLIHEFPVVDN